MDFDDRFDFDEFVDHFNALHLLDTQDPHELIRRTTKDTRGGDAFSFKPVHMWVGSSSSAGGFHSGFDCAIEPKGVDPQKREDAPLSERELASSFWLRFNEAGDLFQFRVFCGAQKISALRPYECNVPFRDVFPSGVELRAQKNGSRILAHLTLRCRRPSGAIVRLVPPLAHRVPIVDRLATEADFFRKRFSDSNEVGAGRVSPLGSNQATVKPGLWWSHRFSFDLTLRQYKVLWQCMPQKLDIAWPDEFSSFGIRYLVEGLVSYGIINASELGLLHKTLRGYEARHRSLILEGLFKINRKGSVGKDVMDVLRRMGPPLQVPPHCMRVRRCLVTPTRCLLQPPRTETSNSMLRAFAEYQDYFLRVQFVDEDEALQITSELLEIDEAMGLKKGVLARLRRAVRSGLDIAGRHYDFLCFGESQVKVRGCWMISETGDFTVRAVLDWIGDLSEERIIAKHAARQGLVLSTSRAVEIKDFKIKVEYDLPDITVAALGHKYTFTDGVGRCSQTLANRCLSTLGHDWRQSTPSAVQVRIGGGIKGVLCVVPDSMIGENVVKVRKSMVKFKSDDTSLNVLKVATYGIAYLNRQAILLLEAQGVPQEILLKLFVDEKDRIEGLEQRAQEQYIATLTTFPLGRAIASGFTSDPLVQNIIRVLKCRLLSDLKWRARIPIEEGTYLIGVADETRTLKEGEVFCQIENRAGRRIITGTCTVYRNPCLHPGDVRLVQAVNSPALSHLKNVIVFSTWGTRDLPSMMGGGDLDGDFYTLLWDKRLIIPLQHEPMDYTPPEPKKVPAGKTITVDDTKEFWLEYLQNDILGMICNAHLALADLKDPGVEDCLVMAKLASQAVDFSKTGVPVERGFCIAPESYPDFMGKDQMLMINQSSKKTPRTHKSEKVLGEMFRSIDPDPVFEPTEAWQAWDSFVKEPTSKMWEGYLKDAATFKTRYDFELNWVLRAYDICEAECVAGVLLRSSRQRVRVDRDHSLRMAVQDAYYEVAASFTEQAAEYLLAHPLAQDPAEDRRAWAFACYKVTYDRACYDAYYGKMEEYVAKLGDNDSEDEADVPAGPVEERHCSFPWLFFKDLLALADGA